MSILFLLIPLSLILLGVAIWAFFWAVDSNQFDDLSGPAYSILYDDDAEATEKAEARKAAGLDEPATEPAPQETAQAQTESHNESDRSGSDNMNAAEKKDS
ncbi:cbb3-type cytochrome oxidase assembly protein CcoS [Oceanospirillum beijerinckii]|uniref:cbb3-type cytochrome oxidase assembly protein CcoS n=1 Tax=Oceanospirillum beijerinckii TaxID=64976 RepID=UPI00041C7445|nr:cbb3-type cytochrome oxidase assembly protein CcoS [Oceanospirillum beijerinckii]MAC48448.1 cbb3-type cytochrome oxidase assembly protein CcoS [Oceanospirillum sp.]